MTAATRRARCPNPACGSPKLTTVLEREAAVAAEDGAGSFAFRLAACGACGLAFVDPTPAPEVLARCYQADYTYHATGEAPAPLVPRFRRAVAERCKAAVAPLRYRRQLGGGGLSRAGEILARTVEAMGGRSISYTLAVPLCLPRSASMLDYGVGTGDWLESMQRRGYRCLYGYDLPQNAENCRRLTARGIPTACGDPPADLPVRRFDLVRLEHVFEHLPDPVATLRKLRSLLRPGGYLVMTFPSIEPWEPLEGLAGSPHLDHLQLPIHLFHHSRASARGFAAAAGLEGIRIRRLEPFGYLSLLAREPGGGDGGGPGGSAP